MKINRFLKAVFFFAIFTVALALFVFMKIDETELKRNLQKTFLQKGAAELSMESIDIAFPGKLTLKGVDITRESGTRFHFKKLEARILWSSLITFSPAVAISAQTSEGYLRLKLVTGIFGGGLRRVEIGSERFSLGEAIVSIGKYALPFGALLDVKRGTIETGGVPAESSGLLKLELSNFTTKKNVGGAFFIQKAKPESGTCEIEVKDGVLSIKNCRLKGAAGRVELELSSRIKEPFVNTTLTGNLIVKPVDEMLKSLLTIYSKFKKGDGSYHFPLRGTFAEPKIPLAN